MNHCFRHLLGAAVALALLPTVAVATPAESPSMPEKSTTTVTSPLATLQVAVRYDKQQQKLAFSWTLDNTGHRALAVFDQGNTLAWRRKPLAAGEVADVLRRKEDGVMVLSHRAEALPDPAPTVPPIPLAGRLDAGATGKASFSVDLLATPKTVRYCLGVAPFNESDYAAAEKAGDGIWRAGFKVVDEQTLLCTPVFDLHSGHFESATASNDAS